MDRLVYAFNATVGGNICEAEGRRFARLIGGIGWGYANFAMALAIGLDGDRRSWALEEFYQRRECLEETIIPAIIGLTRQYGVVVWCVGAKDPDAIDWLNAALGAEDP